MSLFDKLELAPIDPILGTTLLYKADQDSRKVDLGVGAYRSNAGVPTVLQVVKVAQAEMLASTVANELNKEYSTIDGPAELKKLTQNLMFGEGSKAVAENRIASSQTLSGTGALRVLLEFIRWRLPESPAVYVSNPTWGNHIQIAERAKFEVKKYRYWSGDTKGLDFEGMVEDLKNAEEGSVIILHPCAHNPTGVDPSEAQWKEISAVIKARKLLPLLDSAYQGYATGDFNVDAWTIRHFVEEGHTCFVSQSFAKNMGLYGERMGMLHVVCSSEDEAKRVLSQLKLVIRPMYSNPPRNGAEIVLRVMGNEKRYAEWKQEILAMSERILRMRRSLREGLEKRETPGKWDHITSQIGMFSFTGLSIKQSERMMEQHHVYMLKSGRISIAGLTDSNVDYVADSIDEVVRAVD